jgi:hypothetical protein
MDWRHEHAALSLWRRVDWMNCCARRSMSGPIGR